MRVWMYIGLGGVLLTGVCWFVVPLAAGHVWMLTLSWVGVGAVSGLIGLAVVGVNCLARYFAKPS